MLYFSLQYLNYITKIKVMQQLFSMHNMCVWLCAAIGCEYKNCGLS
jgi:hypothetical protein